MLQLRVVPCGAPLPPPSRYTVTRSGHGLTLLSPDSAIPEFHSSSLKKTRTGLRSSLNCLTLGCLKFDKSCDDACTIRDLYKEETVLDRKERNLTYSGENPGL
ncbi:hypothetical protein BaRGS_00005328 [Batillaria attramentaria]|uniref:Uncharacterized protein n=1 Tax=Batillaria attramentaria TaxID=370345 RepID=A0ABD0LVK9_9CAEN